MDNFEPYNVLLAIATNIPVLLMTAFVLQGHKYALMDRDRKVENGNECSDLELFLTVETRVWETNSRRTEGLLRNTNEYSSFRAKQCKVQYGCSVQFDESMCLNIRYDRTTQLTRLKTARLLQTRTASQSSPVVFSTLMHHLTDVFIQSVLQLFLSCL